MECKHENDWQIVSFVTGENWYGMKDGVFETDSEITSNGVYKFYCNECEYAQTFRLAKMPDWLKGKWEIIERKLKGEE